jgi:hypothetical protein
VDATNGKIVVSKDLLSALLENLETRIDRTPLSAYERESLEQLAVAAMSGNDIAIPEDLLYLWRGGQKSGGGGEVGMRDLEEKSSF